jgi:3-oxo-4,17-pregnadiene-20-carboxyl-CoA hydratase alpha subunit
MHDAADVEHAVREAAGEIAARGASGRREAPDPVNLPMIRHWQEAIGDANAVYADRLVAPPAMVQVWTMYGLGGERPADDPLGAMTRILDDAGFTSVVATNCEQTYHRYLRVGERVSVSSRLADVSGPKRTALGEGWFVTTLSTWYVDEEPVAEMLFRVLKFRPGSARAAGDVLRPVVSRDTEFFWEGTAAGELRIQKCGACGALRHPPGPACPQCGALEPKYVVASGRGEVYSYVVHHHPPVPGKELPFVVALVELEEGVRLLAELAGVPPEGVRIGLPVTASFVKVDDELTFPVWRPR